MSAALQAVALAATALAAKPALAVDAARQALSRAEDAVLASTPVEGRPVVQAFGDALEARLPALARAGLAEVHALAVAVAGAEAAGHTPEAVTGAALGALAFAERHAVIELDLEAHRAAMQRRADEAAARSALVAEVLAALAEGAKTGLPLLARLAFTAALA